MMFVGKDRRREIFLKIYLSNGCSSPPQLYLFRHPHGSHITYYSPTFLAPTDPLAARSGCHTTASAGIKVIKHGLQDIRSRGCVQSQPYLINTRTVYNVPNIKTAALCLSSSCPYSCHTQLTKQILTKLL